MGHSLQLPLHISDTIISRNKSYYYIIIMMKGLGSLLIDFNYNVQVQEENLFLSSPADINSEMLLHKIHVHNTYACRALSFDTQLVQCLQVCLDYDVLMQMDVT